jgi:hypothetical protein
MMPSRCATVASYILPTRRGALIATLAIMLLTSMNYALSLGCPHLPLHGGMVAAAALLATFRNLAGIAVSPPRRGRSLRRRPRGFSRYRW